MSTNRHGSEFMDFIKQKGKTPEEVANVLGVTLRAFFYWTSGKREPRFTIKQVQDLCAFLNCSVQELPPDFGPNKSAGV